MATAIPIILAVVSTAATVYSSVQSGNAEEKADKRAARQAMAAAQREAADTKKKHQRIIASQEAKFGASGLTMEGSPLLVQMESLKESEEQLGRILQGGGMKAEAYEEAGEQAQTAGYAGGVKGLLSGADTVYKTGTAYNWWS
jgi:hypothetical protein